MARYGRLWFLFLAKLVINQMFNELNGCSQEGLNKKKIRLNLSMESL